MSTSGLDSYTSEKRKSAFYENGTINMSASADKKKVRTREYNIALCLLVLSLSVVVAKLYVNYVDKAQMSEAAEELLNIGNKYKEAIQSTTVSLSLRYGWLIRALMCGLIMTGFSWFIVYYDSNVPGVNPPAPFRSPPRRFSKGPAIQINYIVGAVNGLLVFVFMCLYSSNVREYVI